MSEHQPHCRAPQGFVCCCVDKNSVIEEDFISKFIAHEGWVWIQDQRGIAHHVPGYELLLGMCKLYYGEDHAPNVPQTAAPQAPAEEADTAQNATQEVK